LILKRPDKKSRKRGPVSNNRKEVRRARKASHPRDFNRRRLLGLGLGCLVLLICVVLWLWWPTLSKNVDNWLKSRKDFLIKEIIVVGNLRTSRQEIVKALRFAPRQLIFGFNLEKARQRVAALPFVREVFMRRRWPDRLEIRIREHQPKALLYLDRLYLVSEQGEVLAPAPRNEILDYPLISGVTPEQWRQRPRVWMDLLRKTVRLLGVWERLGREWPEKVAQVVLDEVCGLTVFTTPRVWELQLGHRDFSRRLRHWRQVLEFLGQRSEAVKYFDCAGEDMVVAGLRP